MSDAGMTAAELQAFHTALVDEMNPNHLFGFASALAPDHCTSASMLHARGTLLEKRHVLGAPAVTGAMERIHALAFRPDASPTPPTELLRLRNVLDALARELRDPPAIVHRNVRQTAGEMVVDSNATFGDVPHVVVALARVLVVSVGPVRVLHPSAVRLALPPAPHLTSIAEAAERARWTRQYLRGRGRS